MNAAWTLTRRQRAFLHAVRILPMPAIRVLARAFPSLRPPFPPIPTIDISAPVSLQIFNASTGELIYDGPPNLDASGMKGGHVVIEHNGMFLLDPNSVTHPPHDTQACPTCGAVGAEWTE